MLTVMGPWEKGCSQQSLDVALRAHDPQAWSQCGFQLSLLDSESLNESAIRPEFCSTSKTCRLRAILESVNFITTSAPMRLRSERRLGVIGANRNLADL